MNFELGSSSLDTALLFGLTRSRQKLSVSADAAKQLDRYRNMVDNAIASGKTVYGLNTGFGFLSHVRINESELDQLQANLVRSHACGVGEALSPDLTRALLILRAHTFCLGYSGVTRAAVDMILAFLDHDILPVIPVQGSVGASGDLAPLAHLALGLMGEGQVFYKGKVAPAEAVLSELGIKPLRPQAKEGLSLINGTHFMTAVAAAAIEEARILSQAADIIACLSLDALRGSITPFDPRIHALRPHRGQRATASNVLMLFKESDPILDSHAACDKVQDPYSFRCIPQVHGSSKDAISFAKRTVDIELNSVTDNPLCFDEESVLSGGNFHGEPIAMAMDFLKIAIAELGSISERRIEKLTNPALSGLPAFITKNGGLNSGYMIPHVVAAALASENKTLATPASVDSIPTSADKEDHVSMGPIAARGARSINANVANILAIELLAACQGIDLLGPLKPNKTLATIYDMVRSVSPSMDTDRSLSQDIKQVSHLILQGELSACINKQGIPWDEGL